MNAEAKSTHGAASDETRRADERDGLVQGHADRPPTEDEEAVAERMAADVPDEVAANYEEMLERGANVKGEGQIEPEGAQTS